MKKLILFLFVIFQISFAFGQTNWENWTTVSCYNGFSTSVLGNGFVPSINQYSWQVRIKSAYTKKVVFNMSWIVGGERLSIGQVTLNPGESYGHTPRYFNSSSNNISVEVSEVCFEGQDCFKNGYADCNGNQNAHNTSSNNSNNTSNTKNSGEIYEKVDSIPEFPGGINAFRLLVANKIDQSKINATGTIKTIVAFVVEIDGSLSNVKAEGVNSSFNNEANKVVSEISERWIPAKLENKNVRFHIKLPLTLLF